MKQIIVIILVVFSISIASSQTRFESFQLPNSGQIDTVLSSNSNSAQVSGTGNQNFDLTSASSIIETPIKYEAVSSNASYPNANIKTTLGNGLGSIFLEKTQNDLLVRGLALNAGGFPLSFAMKGNLKYLTAPLYYNMPVNSSTDKASVYLPGSLIPDSLVNTLLASQLPTGATATIDSIEIRLTVTSNLSADAYGKLSTPIESNVNCLRVLRDLNFKIGVYPKGKVKISVVSFPIPEIDLASFLLAQAPIPIPTNLKSHIFFAANSKPEVATATLDSLGKAYTLINYRKSSKAVSGITSIVKSNIDISYSNNVADIFCNTISAKSVSLHNVMGQEVHHFRWMSPDARIDLNDLESGIYFLTIQENEKDKTVYKLFRP
jgi:hypothetical protein